jgi:hypothetical protein
LSAPIAADPGSRTLIRLRRLSATGSYPAARPPPPRSSPGLHPATRACWRTAGAHGLQTGWLSSPPLRVTTRRWDSWLPHGHNSHAGRCWLRAREFRSTDRGEQHQRKR